MATSATTRSRSVGIELRQGRVQGRFVAHRLAGEEARQLEVVVAQQEQAAAFVDQAEHDAQHAGVVGSVIGEVAKLHHEAVGGGGVAERDGVAVHVAHHADGRVVRDGSEQPCRCSLRRGQPERNVPSAKLNSRSRPSRNTRPPRGNSRAMAGSRTSSPPV